MLHGRLEHAKLVGGIASVNAEVLLVSAFEFSNARWKADGWNVAEVESERIARRLRVAPEDWDELLDEHGELWDPPAAHGELYPFTIDLPPPFKFDIPPMNGGRLGPRSRIQLSMTLEEDIYSQFLRGERLADVIFFDLPEGSIQGPYRGPWGYYLVKVVGRTPPEYPFELQRELAMDTLREGWLCDSFIEFAHEALRQAK